MGGESGRRESPAPLRSTRRKPASDDPLQDAIANVSLQETIYGWCPETLQPYWQRVEASHLGARLVRGVFWTLAGTVISRGVILVSGILIARLLGKTAFGEFGIIQSTVGMFGVFAGLGLGITATKYVSQFRKADPLKAGRIMALTGAMGFLTGGVATVGMVLLAPWLASRTLAAPHMGSLLAIGSGLLFFTAMNGVQNGALAGLEAFRTIAWVNLISSVACLPIIIAGAWWGGLKGAVWGSIASQASTWALAHFALRREALRSGLPLFPKGWTREWPVLWKFSLPMLLSGMLISPVNWICCAMLVNVSNGYSEMGVFNAANQWFSVLLFLPGILGQAVFPMFAECHARGDRANSIRIVLTSVGANLLVVVPMIVLASLASPWIMRCYGAAFQDQWPTLTVVLITGGLTALLVPASAIFAVSGRMWIGAFTSFGWALAFIGLTVCLVQHGALGLASARLGAYGIHAVWTAGLAYYIVRKDFSINGKISWNASPRNVDAETVLASR